MAQMIRFSTDETIKVWLNPEIDRNRSIPIEPRGSDASRRSKMVRALFSLVESHCKGGRLSESLRLVLNDMQEPLDFGPTIQVIKRFVGLKYRPTDDYAHYLVNSPNQHQAEPALNNQALSSFRNIDPVRALEYMPRQSVAE